MKYAGYLLTFAFLTFSISCTTAANGNQTTVLSQNAADSGTASSSTNSETSEAQTAAPDAVVRELYKLHDADKSPLYTTNRASVEKFFSKDFVKLIWREWKNPNILYGENSIALEGDALTGLDSLSKSESETVGKAQINGSKATVPVTINASDEENKKFKNSLNYELVKETGGWRVADIKSEGFYTGSLVNTITSFKKGGDIPGKTPGNTDKELDAEFTIIKPPFVGKRWFNTNPEASGSGTPQFYLKINSENYAFCGFTQTNQSDGTVTEEEIPLGRFKKTFDCNFTKINEKHSYKIEGNYIYELNENKKVISDKTAFIE